MLFNKLLKVVTSIRLDIIIREIIKIIKILDVDVETCIDSSNGIMQIKMASTFVQSTKALLSHRRYSVVR